MEELLLQLGTARIGEVHVSILSALAGCCGSSEIIGQLCTLQTKWSCTRTKASGWCDAYPLFNFFSHCEGLLKCNCVCRGVCTSKPVSQGQAILEIPLAKTRTSNRA